MGVVGELAPRYMDGRAGPVTCLPCSSENREKYPLPLLLPATGGRQRGDPDGVTRAALVLPLTYGSTAELAQDVRVVGEAAREHECGKAGPAACPMGGGKDEMSSSPPLSLAIMADGRAGPGVMREGELATLLTSCKHLREWALQLLWAVG